MTFWVNRKYYLGDRIEVAKEKLLFDENFFEMVDCVNNTANDLIHPDRYETVNLDDDKVCQILMKTVVCISILEGEDSHG